MAAPAWAGLAEGAAAYLRGDYATALREWRPLAEQGDALAQSVLGGMYEKGEGVPQDYAEAVKWYRKAAEQGFDRAQLAIGSMYGKGHGVPQDYAEAAKWILKAANQGNAKAQSALGIPGDVGLLVASSQREGLEHREKRDGPFSVLYGPGIGILPRSLPDIA